LEEAALDRLPPPTTKDGPAWSLVKTVSAGWQVKTATAPLAQPAIKSTHASETVILFS
jgi:hypothetical protein